MPAAETARLIAELSLKDNLSKGVRSATASLNTLDKSFGRTQKSLGQTAANIGRLGVVAAGAATVGFVGVVNAARDWESAFAGVRKTVDPTTVDLNELSESLRAMAREMPISAGELAGLAEAAGALGIAGKDIEEFVRVTALIGVTTDVAAQDAATALGQLSNILGLTGADYDNFAATLVDLGNKGASTESQILEFAGRVAGAGKLIGLSAGEVLGFSSALANAGLEAEAGGTAISRFFLETFKDVTKGGKDLKTLAKLAGQTAKEFQTAFKEDAAGALEAVLVGLSKMSEAQRLVTLEALGFKEVRVRDTLLRLTGDSDNLTSALDTQAEAWTENTALTKEAEQRFKTFDSQLTITKQVLNDIAITIGSKLLPKITPLLQRLNDFVAKNQGKIEEFGTRLADGFEDFATAVGKVDWKPFIEGLQITAGIAREAIGLFMSLPPDVQKIAIAALAVNKVTGGLGTSIVKDLAGLALRSLTTINAAHVTVVGASVTGGVPGAAAGAGKPSLLTTAGNALTGAMVIAALQEGAKLATKEVVTEVTGSTVAGTKTAEVTGQSVNAFSPPILSTLEQIQRVLSGDNRGLLERIADEEEAAGGRIVQSVNGLVAKLDQSADRTKDDRVNLQALREGTHAINRIPSEMLRGFRDTIYNSADLKTLPKLLSFYQTSVHPSEKSIANDMSALKAMEAHYLAVGDTKNAATVTAAISTLQTVLNSAETREAAKVVAANQASAFAIRDKVETGTAAMTTAQRIGAERTATAATGAGVEAATAIRNKDLSVEVNVPPTRISIHNIIAGVGTLKTIYQTAS